MTALEAWAVAQLGRWFARCIIAEEIHPDLPLPVVLRDAIAAELVADSDSLGWPDLESAQATLDEWAWA